MKSIIGISLMVLLTLIIVLDLVQNKTFDGNLFLQSKQIKNVSSRHLLLKNFSIILLIILLFSNNT